MQFGGMSSQVVARQIEMIGVVQSQTLEGVCCWPACCFVPCWLACVLAFHVCSMACIPNGLLNIFFAAFAPGRSDTEVQVSEAVVAPRRVRMLLAESC